MEHAIIALICRYISLMAPDMKSNFRSFLRRSILAIETLEQQIAHFKQMIELLQHFLSICIIGKDEAASIYESDEVMHAVLTLRILCTQ